MPAPWEEYQAAEVKPEAKPVAEEAAAPWAEYQTAEAQKPGLLSRAGDAILEEITGRQYPEGRGPIEPTTAAHLMAPMPGSALTKGLISAVGPLVKSNAGKGVAFSVGSLLGHEGIKYGKGLLAKFLH